MNLPPILTEIAEVAGEDAALTIARVRGGTSIYIPPVPANDHWLCRLIGRDEAKAVCAHLTRGQGRPRRLELPLGPTGSAASARAQVDELLGADMSERDIALRTGYTIRGIRLRRKKLGIKRNDGQLSLF
ncbi:helix-turn-helix domain-containing protein [Sphingopyxis sp. GW247-27LB]|uniref:helix-turn-helix domain-containing protein n=1 Tax=Sphingopyxis sp. GW247-27LB TaxID=2012632 RepID=UPI000BA5ABDB|nr:helix-turn-helix domain-containing protein [Sphingopyxis sp. GW247-27LB]PAL20202.1 helix-turn-helix domain-containing protein [Sphingopyxis sp. GW247-27LB]